MTTITLFLLMIITYIISIITHELGHISQLRYLTTTYHLQYLPPRITWNNPTLNPQEHSSIYYAGILYGLLPIITLYAIEPLAGLITTILYTIGNAWDIAQLGQETQHTTALEKVLNNPTTQKTIAAIIITTFIISPII